MQKVGGARYPLRFASYELAQRFRSALAQPRWWILLGSLVFTLLPLPWVIATWVPQGDEPHYLLAAHSLVFDGDLDLANNYARGDFARFYPGPLGPHVRIGMDGRSYLSHDIGLPVLITPAYALGGRAGVTIFLACIAALLGLNVYGLAHDVSADRRAAAVTWLIFALAPLLSVYAYLVYPEMMGALAVVWAARQTLRAQRLAHHPSLVVFSTAIAIAMLPWLSARFIPIALFLAAWAMWAGRRQSRYAAIVLGVWLLSLSGYLAVNAWLSGGAAGAMDYNADRVALGLQNFTLERVPRGLAGWWLDQQRGVLAYAPAYVIALAGLPLLWRSLRWTGAALLAPLLLAYGLAVAWGGFWVGWEMSARYLVVGLPLLAAPMSLALARVRGLAVRGLAAGLFALSALNTAVLLAQPGLFGYRESIVWFYDRLTELDVWRALPAMGGGGRVDPDLESPSAEIVTDGGRTAWHAPAGQGGAVIQSDGLKDLTVGAYELRFDARAARNPSPDAPLLSVEVFSGEGLILLHRVLTASDFVEDGAYRSFAVPFESPFYNKWSYPVYAQISSSGLAEVWVSDLSVSPDAGPTWGKVALWVALIGWVVVAFNRSARVEEGRP